MRVVSKVWNLHSEFGHARPLDSRIVRYVRDGRTRADKSNAYRPLSPAAKLVFLTNLALQDPQQVFADYVPMNPIYQESEWCQAGTIEHFEKMASFHGSRHQNMKY